MNLIRLLSTILIVLTSLAWRPAVSAERVPWTTSAIRGTPDPPSRYITERVFSSLSFHEPVEMSFLPGTDWLYVMELTGKVFAFDGRQEEPQPVLVFDARANFDAHNHSYGLTFHPDVSDNRHVYISWTLPGALVEDGTHVCQFDLSDDQPPKILPDTRKDIITWPSGGHNGAALKFGPDGYLYISAGDGVGPFPPDSEETGQDLGDLRSTIFRIDVDSPVSGRDYDVPSDNPFLDVDSARPEVWAYGFRNPWKMSFSPLNGDLFVGDVGWELWEMVYRVEKGGNYGWSVMEGRQPVRADVKRGPTPILPPLADHLHTEARSITGGYVYRGQQLSDLQGAYVYGDYVTGKIWGLRNEENHVTWQEELADTSLAIITFGENRQGDLFIVDYAGGVYRLRENPDFGQPSDFPMLLSETGLFSDVAGQHPASGVRAYDLISEPWMDGATARRFVALPGESSIVATRNRLQWKYPPGTVFVKTISMPPGHGNVRPDNARKLETQLLHHDGDEWRPYTYIWNDEQTDARLAPAEGSQTTILTDGQERTWRFHSRAECSTCHTPRGGDTLGFFPQNLLTSDDAGTDQLSAFADLHIFSTAISERDLKPPMVDPNDDSSDLEARARAYLMINCAHCHRRGGGGTSPIEFPNDVALEKTNAVDALPTQGTFNIPHARIIAPGDPYRSVLYYRMATVGRGHMPHLGTREVDSAGLKLLHDWIASLDEDASSSSSASSPASSSLGSEGDIDLTHNSLSTTPAALRAVNAIDEGQLAADDSASLIAVGSRNEDSIVRGLFERYLPQQERSKRLGTLVNAAEILTIEGDAGRGGEFFKAAEGVQCRNCHRAGNVGREVGPDLEGIAKRLTREQLLESILEPSRKVDAKWVGYTLVTTDGRVLSGIIRERSGSSLILRDLQGKDHHIATDDVDELAAQQKSLMPELLVQDMTREQLADLLAFLANLK